MPLPRAQVRGSSKPSAEAGSAVAGLGALGGSPESLRAGRAGPGRAEGGGAARIDDALPALPGGGLRLESAAAAAAGGGGAGGSGRAARRKEARERRGLGVPQCHSNSVPGRSRRGPSSCPAVAHCIERAVCAEPRRGGKLGAGLSGGSAEPLGCRGALDAGCLRAAAADGLRCPLRPCRLARVQRCLPNKLLVPGRTATAVRAEPREGESGLGSPIVHQEPGRDARETAVFRDFPGPYWTGIGGRCWGGRPLASCLGERGVAGSGVGLPGERSSSLLGAIGDRDVEKTFSQYVVK